MALQPIIQRKKPVEESGGLFGAISGGLGGALAIGAGVAAIAGTGGAAAPAVAGAGAAGAGAGAAAGGAAAGGGLAAGLGGAAGAVGGAGALGNIIDPKEVKGGDLKTQAPLQSVNRRLQSDPQAILAQLNQSQAAIQTLDDRTRQTYEPFILAAQKKARGMVG